MDWFCSVLPFPRKDLGKVGGYRGYWEKHDFSQKVKLFPRSLCCFKNCIRNLEYWAKWTITKSTEIKQQFITFFFTLNSLRNSLQRINRKNRQEWISFKHMHSESGWIWVNFGLFIFRYISWLKIKIHLYCPYELIWNCVKAPTILIWHGIFM